MIVISGQPGCKRKKFDKDKADRKTRSFARNVENGVLYHSKPVTVFFSGRYTSEAGRSIPNRSQRFKTRIAKSQSDFIYGKSFYKTPS